MCRRHQLWLFILVAISSLERTSIWAFDRTNEAERLKRPNIIVVFVDDMGYADIGPFGSSIPTPSLDQMARNGRTFTDFIVPSAVCSASRAGLLTGCIPERVSIRGALGPNDLHGIAEEEVTIGELCQSRGYATCCIGKWHLGHHPKFLPTRHGFDQYFGLPYSNDMWPRHPDLALLSDADRRKRYPPLPLLQQERVILAEVTEREQALLTRDYTRTAIDFIQQNRDQPFLIYLAHSMVHVPIFASDQYLGRSGMGLFADVVMEIDHSMGEILSTLEELELTEHTWVIFTSDNGPWLSYGDHAGSAGPLREGKGTAWEGGVRVPTIMQWPDRIPKGSKCEQLASTIDLLPTIAAVIEAKLPDHKIDGKNISSLLMGSSVQSPHESFPYYFADGQLQAVRDQRWKLVFPHTYRSLGGRTGGSDGLPVPYENKRISLSLFDLENDLSETTDVSEQFPEVVERLTTAAEEWRDALGDTLTQRVGRQVRPHGTLLPDEPRLTW